MATIATVNSRLFSSIPRAKCLAQLQNICRYYVVSHNLPPAIKTSIKKSGIIYCQKEIHSYYCSQNKATSFRPKCTSSGAISTEVGTEELETLLKDGQVQLIDIREPEELTETGTIPSSINIPLGSLDEVLQMSPDDFKSTFSVKKPTLNDTDIIFYCKAGRRSRVAMEIACNHGYTHVRHYYPGMDGWLDDH